MSGALFNLLAFIVALGVLVTIHEYGHFWVARRCGVKVLRFSVGFGKPLWMRRGKVDDTEYVIAAIPLGGYVKMLDEREAPVPAEERHRAFNRKSVWARIAIVAAGPVANFLLAIAAYWLTFVIGISGLLPLVGAVPADSPAAAAGFVEGDRIVSVAGQSTPTWNSARLAIMEAALDTDAEGGDGNAGGAGRVAVDVEDAYGLPQTRLLDIGNQLLKEEGDAVGKLGLTPWWPQVEPVIAGVQPEGAAARAGLRAGDRILSGDGERIDSWRQWVDFVRARPDSDIALLIERDGTQLALSLRPARRDSDGGEIGYIGAWEDQTAAQLARIRTVVRHDPLESIARAVERTWEMSSLTLRVLGKLVIGEAALSNISGPLTIAQYAGQSASIGLDHYLNFIALISISLGVLNLLPVPMLDGGHLLYFGIELVKGRPVSEQTQIWGQQLGMLLIMALMGLALYNDLSRLLG